MRRENGGGRMRASQLRVLHTLSWFLVRGSHGVSNDVVSFQNNAVTDIIIMLSNLCSDILSFCASSMSAFYLVGPLMHNISLSHF